MKEEHTGKTNFPNPNCASTKNEIFDQILPSRTTNRRIAKNHNPREEFHHKFEKHNDNGPIAANELMNLGRIISIS